MTPTPEQLRKIDAVIAEKVMGARIVADERNYRGCYEEYDPPLSGNVKWRDLLHYTTDPAASKQVREKLAEQGFGYQLQRGLESYEDGTFMAFIWRLNVSHRETHRAYADTEELAVALCALKSIGIEVAEILGGER